MKPVALRFSTPATGFAANGVAVGATAFITNLASAVPAAGVDPAALVVPAGFIWRPKSLFASLTTSAVAGNRVPAVVIQDNAAHVLYRSEQGGTQLASTVVNYSFAKGVVQVTDVANNGFAVGLLPDIDLLPGYTIGLATNGKDAGDQWTAQRILVDAYQASGSGAGTTISLIQGGGRLLGWSIQETSGASSAGVDLWDETTNPADQLFLNSVGPGGSDNRWFDVNPPCFERGILLQVIGQAAGTIWVDPSPGYEDWSIPVVGTFPVPSPFEYGQ